MPTSTELETLLHPTNPTNYTIQNHIISNQQVGGSINSSSYSWFDGVVLNGNASGSATRLAISGYIANGQAAPSRYNSILGTFGSTVGSNTNRGVARYWSSTMTSGFADILEVHPTFNATNSGSGHTAHGIIVKGAGKVNGSYDTDDVLNGGTNKHINDRYKIRCVRQTVYNGA